MLNVQVYDKYILSKKGILFYRGVFMLASVIILAISSSIDSLGIGITYGIKNTKISYLSYCILFIISFLIATFAIWLGGSIRYIFSEEIAKWIGSIILILMGFFILIQSFKKEKNYKEIHQDEKIFSLFIKFLGITIQIIKNPINSDLDKSKRIEAKEAIFLGFALSLDSLCIGTGSSIIGIKSSLFPILISSFQIIFLQFGNILGMKLRKVKRIPDNIWSIISGALLICIGIFKLF